MDYIEDFTARTLRSVAVFNRPNDPSVYLLAGFAGGTGDCLHQYVVTWTGETLRIVFLRSIFLANTSCNVTSILPSGFDRILYLNGGLLYRDSADPGSARALDLQPMTLVPRADLLLPCNECFNDSAYVVTGTSLTPVSLSGLPRSPEKTLRVPTGVRPIAMGRGLQFLSEVAVIGFDQADRAVKIYAEK